MKKITKLFVFSLSVLLAGVVTACKDPEFVYPKGDYTPTEAEQEFLDDIENNQEIAKFTADSTRAIKPNTIFVNDARYRSAVFQDREDTINLATAIKLPVSANDYALKIEWSIGSFGENAIFLNTFDSSHHIATFAFKPYIEPVDGVNQPQEITYTSVIARMTFGNWSKVYTYDLALTPGELPQKATIKEAFDLYASGPTNTLEDSPWLHKRLELTGRIYDHFDDKDIKHGTSWGYRAGIFILDASGYGIMLYAQKSTNNKYGTVLAEQFAIQKLKIGDIITIRGSLTHYNGAPQMHGITSVTLVKDADRIAELAIPNDISTIANAADAFLAGVGAGTKASAPGPLGSEQHVAFLRTAAHRRMTVQNLTFKRILKGEAETVVNDIDEPSVVWGTDEPAVADVWSNYSRYVVEFETSAGLTLRCHVNYHVGPTVVAAFRNVLATNRTNPNARYNVNALGAYSTLVFEPVLMGTNGITLA